MDNVEKDKVAKVFNTVWDLTKRYAFIPLDDFLWERFVDELEEKSKEFKAVDTATWILYRDIVGAVQKYKVTKDKENKNAKSMGTMADRSAGGTLRKDEHG